MSSPYSLRSHSNGSAVGTFGCSAQTAKTRAQGQRGPARDAQRDPLHGP